MHKILNLREWEEEEWRVFASKLKELSVEQLRQVAADSGVIFEGGIESIIDKKGISAKEQIILVLDEVPKEKLTVVYKKILANK